MQFPITIGLRRSFFAASGMALILGVAAFSVLWTPWPFWVRGAILAVLAASFLAIPWQAGRRKIEALRLIGDGRLECRLAGDGDFCQAELLPGATVHPCLTVIRLKAGGTVYSAALFPDSADGEELRRLRVWLRWRARFSVGKGRA